MMPTNALVRHRSAGFTMAEMMIAMGVGMLLLAGMATLFVTNNRAQAEVEKSNRQVENGRYAMQLITGDLSNAGYYGEFDPTVLTAAPAAPTICTPTLAEVRSNLRAPVHGVDNATPAGLPCLTDIKEGTDVLVVQRTQTCVAGTGNCAAASAGGMLLQPALCASKTQLGASSPLNHFRLDTSTAAMDRTNRACTGAAPIRRFLVHAYYVANNHKAGDAIPTLMLAELDIAAGGAGSWTIQPVVEGIENMQLEYGIDNNADGAPDLYNANPAVNASCPTAAVCPDTRWTGAVATKVHLLARNTTPTAGFTDTKTYTLGLKADLSDNEVGPANDRFKRHVFQSTVAIPNTAGRRTP